MATNRSSEASTLAVLPLFGISVPPCRICRPPASGTRPWTWRPARTEASPRDRHDLPGGLLLLLEESPVGRMRLVTGGALLALRPPQMFRGALLVVAGDAQRLVPRRGQRRVAGALG